MPRFGVNWLAYGVSVRASSAINAAHQVQEAAAGGFRLEILGGPAYCSKIQDELRALAARAAAAGARGEAAWQACLQIARPEGGGPVIEAAEGRGHSWADDDVTSSKVASSFRDAADAEAEASLVLELISALVGLAREECMLGLPNLPRRASVSRSPIADRRRPASLGRQPPCLGRSAPLGSGGLRLLEGHHGDRPEHDGALLDLDLEEGLFV